MLNRGRVSTKMKAVIIMKYIFFEMDFYLSHHTISTVMKDEFQKAIEKGYKLYLCTLRNKGSLKAAASLPLSGFIASAGAYVQVGSQVLCNDALTSEDVYKLETALNGLGIRYQLETTDTIYQNIHFLKRRLGALLVGADVSVETGKRIKQFKADAGIASLNKYQGEPVHKIGFLTDRAEKVRQIEAAYGDAYQFVYLDDIDKGIHGEIRPKYMSVSDGVHQILKYEGASIQDALALVEVNDQVGLKDVLPHVVVMDEDAGRTIESLI